MTHDHLVLATSLPLLLPHGIHDLEAWNEAVCAGAYGTAPASVTVISGDVHHSYLASVDFPAETNSRGAVYQAVCSPVHNVLPRSLRRGHRLATSRAGGLAAAVLARLAGVREPRIRWRLTHGPWFSNMLAALEFSGRAARIRFDRAVPDASGGPALRPVAEADLTQNYANA